MCPKSTQAVIWLTLNVDVQFISAHTLVDRSRRVRSETGAFEHLNDITTNVSQSHSRQRIKKRTAAVTQAHDCHLSPRRSLTIRHVYL